MFHELSNRFYELSYFKYLAAKLQYWRSKDEREIIGDQAGTDGITLVNGQLEANGKSIVEQLKDEKII